MAQWSKALHLSASCAIRDSGFAAGRDREAHGEAHNLPIVVQVTEGLAGRMSLSHRALVTPVAGRVQCVLTRLPGVWCFLRYIGAAGFRIGWALCQEAVGWVVSEDTFLSRVRMGVAAMRQDCNYYQLDTMKKG